MGIFNEEDNNMSEDFDHGQFVWDEADYDGPAPGKLKQKKQKETRNRIPITVDEIR